MKLCAWKKSQIGFQSTSW